MCFLEKQGEVTEAREQLMQEKGAYQVIKLCVLSL